MRLTLVMLSLTVVTVLMAAVTALVTTTTTAETPTAGQPSSGSSSSATPSDGSDGGEPVCGGNAVGGLPAHPPAGGPLPAEQVSAAHSGVAPETPRDVDVPCPSSGTLYSHSWYVTDPDSLPQLGATDAQWLNVQTARLSVSSCPRAFLTVLDFGHPTLKYGGHLAPLDAYAMTLFGYKDTWRTFHEIEQLAERYLDAWIGAVSSCPHLTLVLGANNFGECQYAAGACGVAEAGQYWDVAAHDVMDYVAAKGYASQVTGVWVGDDLETSWDPWATTARFLNGVQTQEQSYMTHAQLVDYGDARPGVCSVVTGSCRAPWTAQNVYDATWNLGWDVPLPELYSPETAARWESLVRAFPDIQYRGVMTECGGSDPLPLDGCLAGDGSDSANGNSPGACEWTPAIALSYAVRFAQSVAGHQPPAYATNIQWQPSTIPGTAPSGSMACS